MFTSTEGRIITTPERRPCLVVAPASRHKFQELETRYALFHCFAQVAGVIPPSALRGGHNGGQMAGLTALVEYEDGTVHRVEPESIRFLDSAEQFQKYDWDERDETGHTCETCAHLETPSRTLPCGNCLNFDKWEAAPGGDGRK